MTERDVLRAEVGQLREELRAVARVPSYEPGLAGAGSSRRWCPTRPSRRSASGGEWFEAGCPDLDSAPAEEPSGVDEEA